MPSKNSRVRVNFELDPDIHCRMQRAIPWGMKGPCIRILVERLVDAAEREGLVMVGAVMSGQFRLVYNPSRKKRRKQHED